MDENKKSKLYAIGLTLTLILILAPFGPKAQTTVALSSALPQATPDPPRRVNAPYFSTGVTWAETAIFWFGENKQRVPSRNYTDVRVAYTADALRIRTTVVDYYIWYKDLPDSTDDLTEYDAIAIYLDTSFDRAATPQTDDYTMLVGAHHWPSDNATLYHRQARGDGSGWDTTWSGDWTDYESLQWSTRAPMTIAAT